VNPPAASSFHRPEHAQSTSLVGPLNRPGICVPRTTISSGKLNPVRKQRRQETVAGRHTECRGCRGLIFRRALMFPSLRGTVRKLARTPRRLVCRRARLEVEALEARWVPSAATATAYLATDLVSDQLGVAPIHDSNLVNAWGIAVNPA